MSGAEDRLGAVAAVAGTESEVAPRPLPNEINVYTAGAFDPSAGGSGIFNYLVADWALTHGIAINAVSRASEEYRARHQRPEPLASLIDRGLNLEWIAGNETPGRFAVGLEYLKAFYQFQACAASLEKTAPWRSRPGSATIAHDTGWVLALAARSERGIGVLSDPQLDVFAITDVVPTLNPLKLAWRHLRRYRIGRSFRTLNQELVAALSTGPTAGYLAPQHIPELRDLGLDCRHVNWFSVPPDPSEIALVRQDPRARGRFVLLHVGNLGSTASQNMTRYWRNNVIAALGRLPFAVELRLVGQKAGFAGLGDLPANVSVNVVGFVDDLAKEFAEADAFVSLSDYPIGIRTRILTAMSYGLPVVTHPVALRALPELKAGRDIIAVSDGPELAAFIAAANDDPETLNNVSRHAQQAWQAHFSPARNIPKLLADAWEAMAAPYQTR